MKGDNEKRRNSKAFKMLEFNPALKPLARRLRQAGVLSEVLLWGKLKKWQLDGLDFDRQKIIGNYIVDFYCANVGLVVEIDGESNVEKGVGDELRDEYLESCGLKVLRVRDSDVLRNMEGVIALIREAAGDLEREMRSSKPTTPPRNCRLVSGFIANLAAVSGRGGRFGGFL